MIEIRKSADRGRTRTSWLESRHTFSFAGYCDPAQMGFGPLRVINEDWIAPGRGFGPHAHRDMEILTYMLAGVLVHRDGEGHTSTLRRGRAQLMRAGRGILHSETNGSEEGTAHLLQIWIEPDRLGLAPGYAELDFALDRGALRAIATPGGRRGGLAIRQDACVYAFRSGAERALEYAIAAGRQVWVQVAEGEGRVGGQRVEAGDGAAIREEAAVELSGSPEFELLIFDLPAAGKASPDRNRMPRQSGGREGFEARGEGK